MKTRKEKNTKFKKLSFCPKFIQGIKGLGSRRGEFGPAIEMHTNLKYVYMVYFIEKIEILYA